MISNFEKLPNRKSQFFGGNWVAYPIRLLLLNEPMFILVFSLSLRFTPTDSDN